MFKIIPFISYVFVVTFTPGPNNIISFINAREFGYKKSLKFMLGIFSGFIIIMLLSSYFNLLLYNLIPKIEVYMGVTGAVYMSYLALKLIRGKSKGKQHYDQRVNTFFTGILLQFVNPKVILYGITIMANFIIPHCRSNMAFISFSVLLAAVSFVSITCWGL